MIIFFKIPNKYYYSDVADSESYAYSCPEQQQECLAVKQHYLEIAHDLETNNSDITSVKLLPMLGVDVVIGNPMLEHAVPYSHDALIIVKVPVVLYDNIRNKAIMQNLQAQLPNGRFLLVPKEVEVQVIC